MLRLNIDVNRAVGDKCADLIIGARDRAGKSATGEIWGFPEFLIKVSSRRAIKS
jgi:hypothetical protein